MNCPQCRADVPAGARFCQSCGHELVVVGDQRRVASVLFADIVGFTALSETLDPEQVKALIDRCMARLAADIETFGGRVDKVIGDAIVALFGAPVAHEDDAERAVRAGLRMQESLAALTDEVGHPVRLRVGITTGEVLVGAVQAGREYTAMGDVVNTASRLQTAADPGTVLVDDATRASTTDAIEFVTHDPVSAKGKELPVGVWVAARAIAPPGRRRHLASIPLIGRDDELSLLTSVSTIAIERSRASIQIVHGEAGMGKSRLAGEAMRYARDELGAVTLEGRCVPYGEANVWWPVADAVRSAAGIDADAGRDEIDRKLRKLTERALSWAGRSDEVDRVVNGLYHLLGMDGLDGVGGSLDPSRARDEVIRSVVAVADGFTSTGPILLVFSDLHWADQVVLDLLDTLLVRLARRPFVVLATARRALQERWTPAASPANGVVLHLDPLGEAASRRLLNALCAPGTSGPTDIDDDLADLLIERSGGNPFYLEELVSLVRDAGAASAAEVLSAEHGDLPGTLRALVAARLDGLAPLDRSVLDDAAVLGRRNHVDALALMVQVKRGIEAETARTVVENLAAREFLVIDGESYSFRSDVIREVAYSTLTKADRARAHAGIADWIVRAHKGDDEAGQLDTVASHYASAAELVAEIGPVRGVPDDVRTRALDHLDRAIAQAARDFAPGLIVSLADRALALLTGAEADRRAGLLRLRADGLAELYRVEEAEADVAAALAASTDAGDAHGQARTHLVAANLARHRGDPVAAIDEANAALVGFTDAGDDQGRADALRQLGQAQIFAARFDEAEATLQQALTCFHALADRRGTAWTQQHLAWTSYVAGDIETAERRLDDAVSTFTAIGDHGGLTWSRGLVAWVRFHQGRVDEAAAIADEVSADAAERGERWGASMMGVLRGLIALWSGRTLDAVALLETAARDMRALDDPFATLQVLSALGRARIMTGDRIGGHRDFELGREFNASHGSEPTAASVIDLVELGAMVQLGEVDAARPLVESLEATADGRTFPGDRGISGALAALQSGDVERAQALLDGIAESGRGYAVAVDGLVAAVRGDRTRAVAAAALVDTVVHTYLDRAMALVGAALAHTGAGDVAAARRAIDDATETVTATDDVAAAAMVAAVRAELVSAAGTSWADGDPDAARAAAEAAAARAQTSATGWRRLARAVLS